MIDKQKITIIPSDYGFVDYAPVEVSSVPSELKESFLSYLERGCNASMDYLARNIDKRFNPRALVEGAMTILCFLTPYGPDHGGVAGFAQGEDYHSAIKRRLFRVMEHLRKQCHTLGLPPFEGRAFVDSAPVLERYWAAKAGLGFIGRNNFLISPQFGLRTIISEIICNIPYDSFEPHAPTEVSSCGECGRCRGACPTGALEWNGKSSTIDAGRCISYHTIESKDLSPDAVDCKGWIFGCEECLKVCPWNKDVDGWEELEKNKDIFVNLKPEDWRKMTQEEFDSLFRDSGLKRSGLEKIKNSL